VDAKRIDIQVLRGIAVLAVVLYHAKVVPIAGGYLGVDIFFVISGFLITSHIIDGLSRQRFSFVDFYTRRARRLLPAAFCTLAVTALLASQVLTQARWNDFVAQLLGALTFSANFVLPAQSGYFDTSAETKPLLHMWSLSVEEQYYLLAPLLLAALKPKWRVAALGALAAASLVLCIALASTRFSYWRISWLDTQRFAFFMLPARAWEMLAGSLLAALAQRGQRLVVPRWLKLSALGLLCLTCLMPLDAVHPRGDALVVVVLAAVLMAGDSQWIGSSAPVRAVARVGDWSYSLYLVHWPLFALATSAYLGRVPTSVRLGLVGLAIALAMLQYRFVEQPFRRQRQPGMRTAIRFGAGALMVAALTTATGALRHSSARDTGDDQGQGLYGVSGRCRAGDAVTDLRACSSGPRPTVALWGDSYAVHLVPGLRHVASVGPSMVQLTMPACAPVPGLASIDQEHDVLWARSCVAFNERALGLIMSTDSIRYVILSSPFQGYLEYGPLTFFHRGRQRTVDRSVVIDEFTETLKALIARGKTPILVSPPPRPGFDVGACREQQSNGLLILGRESCDFARSECAGRQKGIVDGLAEISRRAGVQVVWLDKPLCAADGICRTALDDGASIYRDGGHLTARGAEWLLPRTNIEELVSAH
jgi:peptidoglycan/LPS O-acetylase OafA/YrhL